MKKQRRKENGNEYDFTKAYTMVKKDNKKTKNGPKKIKGQINLLDKEFAKSRGLLYSNEAGEGDGGVQQGGPKGGPCVHHGNVIKIG